MEEGKDPNAIVVGKPNQSRVLPPRLIQLPVLFLVLCFSISLFIIYMIRKTGGTTRVASSVDSIPIVQPCVQEQPKTSLDHWIKPPSKLLHSMNDKQLFWRASFVPQLKKYPFPRVPKIAFMFLTKGPLPLAPLWERFFKGHEDLYSIYVHSLPSYKASFSSTSIFNGRQIPSQVAFQRRVVFVVIVYLQSDSLFLFCVRTVNLSYLESHKTDMCLKIRLLLH